MFSSSFCHLSPLFVFCITAAKYTCKRGDDWSYEKAKAVIADSIQMSQSHGIEELEKIVAEESEIYSLRSAIAHAYLSVLKDCEAHCYNEGAEVKRLGGLHVIGTSLHESRRIDNQVNFRFYKL